MLIHAEKILRLHFEFRTKNDDLEDQESFKHAFIRIPKQYTATKFNKKLEEYGRFLEEWRQEEV